MGQMASSNSKWETKGHTAQDRAAQGRKASEDKQATHWILLFEVVGEGELGRTNLKMTVWSAWNED